MMIESQTFAQPLANRAYSNCVLSFFKLTGMNHSNLIMRRSLLRSASLQYVPAAVPLYQHLCALLENVIMTLDVSIMSKSPILPTMHSCAISQNTSE